MCRASRAAIGASPRAVLLTLSHLPEAVLADQQYAVGKVAAAAKYVQSFAEGDGVCGAVLALLARAVLEAAALNPFPDQPAAATALLEEVLSWEGDGVAWEKVQVSAEEDVDDGFGGIDVAKALGGVVERMLTSAALGDRPGLPASSAAMVFHLAAFGGHWPLGSLLVSRDDVETSSFGGTHVLAAAAENGHADFVRGMLALEGAAAVDVNGTEGLPMTRAAEQGHADVLGVLLADSRTDRSAVADALIAAAYSGHEAAVDVLLAAKPPVDVHARSERAVRVAAEHGHEEIVAKLIAHGASSAVAEEARRDGRARRPPVVETITSGGRTMKRVAKSALSGSCPRKVVKKASAAKKSAAKKATG